MDQDPGRGGRLALYLHLVVNKNAIPCKEMTCISIAGLPALMNRQRPAITCGLVSALRR